MIGGKEQRSSGACYLPQVKQVQLWRRGMRHAPPPAPEEELAALQEDRRYAGVEVRAGMAQQRQRGADLGRQNARTRERRD